jgi:hypothetical protein
MISIGVAMNKAVVLEKDWFVGLLVALVFMLGEQHRVQSLEDLGCWLPRTPSDKIGGDRDRRAEHRHLGRWPWLRDYAQMIDILAAGHAKVIDHGLFLRAAGRCRVDHPQDCRSAGKSSAGRCRPEIINPENASPESLAVMAVPASAVVAAWSLHGPAELLQLDALLLEAAKNPITI